MYVSKRGIPLIFQDKEVLLPTITMENYMKWYDIYVVYPNKTVKWVEGSLLTDITSNWPITMISDHCYHPYLLELVAEVFGGVVDNVSLEVTIGRWMLEIKDVNLITI